MAQSLFLESGSPVDFLYLDRNRLASLTGQLSEKGVLTALKSSVGKTQNTEGHVRGSVAVAATDVGRSQSLSESSEEIYDPFWTHAYTFLQDLVANFAVPLEKGRIGSLVSFQAVIQFVDLRLMRDLWEPSMRAFLGSQQAPATSRQQKRYRDKNAGRPKSLPADAQLTLQILQGMPHLFHMTFVSEGGIALWAAVDPKHLTIASENLAMKFGSSIDGL